MVEFPFVDDKHRQAFIEARKTTLRGGGGEAICGARTRTGGACRQPPLKGHIRCLRHAGPKAANLRYERLLRAFARGKVSFEELTRAQRRRAANRTRDLWKRDPWVNGTTIDLGPHEEAFQIEIGEPARRGRVIAPAVLDWLRWRYRRLQIDRRNDASWSQVVSSEMQRRICAAGPQPHDYDPAPPCDPEPVWRVEGKPSWRRQRLDQPRSKRDKPRAVPVRPVAAFDDPQDMSLLYVQHRDILAPIFARCSSDEERRGVLSLLKKVIDDPDDLKARQRWMRLLGWSNA